MSSSLSKSKSSSSLIKGGGRADLSPELEAAIIEYLRSRRDSTNPLLPKIRSSSRRSCCPKQQLQQQQQDDDEKEESPHEAAKNRKRFLKRLVQHYEQYSLSSKLNSQTNTTAPANDRHEAVASSSPSSSGISNVSGKVRVDIMEAIYNNNNNNNNKKSNGNSNNSSNIALMWKPGSIKKTIVLERSTTVEELQILAQTKLQLKKKPNHIFCVEKKKSSSSSSNSFLEIPLVTNLAGLSDGATIHVACVGLPGVSKKSNVRQKAAATAEQEGESMVVDDSISQAELPMDPLEAAKEAYALKEQGVKMSSSWFSSMKNDKKLSRNTERVVFAPHLKQLPRLTTERLQLPASNFRQDILQAMDKSRVVIICGETGCGKSTQIPQYIYEGMLAAGQGEEANIVVTQPRRVAAMALADRVTQEHQVTMCNDGSQATTSSNGSSSGSGSSSSSSSSNGTIAYQVRLDSTVTKRTKITYCTVGILLRRLTSFRSNDDVPLADVSHLIIDEVHERDCNTDFCLTILRHALAVNPRLSLILMSATNTPDLFVKYFAKAPQLNKDIKTVDWNPPVVLEIPGRTFPVETVWLTDIEKSIHKTMKGALCGSESSVAPTTADDSIALSPKATAAIDYDFVSSLIQSISSGKYSVGENKSGAVLVFLPGKAEIEAQHRSLQRTLDESCFKICTLHSGVSKYAQRSAFCPPPGGKTKVVLATNIAETSITIPDIGYVIDSGLVKEVRYNAATSMEELVTVWTSWAAGTQRQGRAGRTGPGVCFKLYTEQFAKANFLDRTTPEILRTPLEELVLSVCLLDETRSYRQSKDDTTSPCSRRDRRPPGTRIIRFLAQAPEPPRNDSLKNACMHLVDVGALKIVSNDVDDGSDLCVKVTPLGFHLAHFPLNAKLGKVLILGSILGCIDTALTVAASLSTTKPLWLNCPGASTAHRDVVRMGFGGEGWSGGTVKGDLIASVAAFNAWNGQGDDRLKRKFSERNFLNHQILTEISSLRHQFRNCLEDAGFVPKNAMDDGNEHSENALLASCCILAGLYPNIATLVRPVKGKLGFRGGRLLTRNGDLCVPSSSSFQTERVQSVSETGRDAYAVYHSKLKLSGTDSMRPDRIVLDGVNFVSRFALILFGGELQVRDNFLVLDEWLKFKVGGSGSNAGSGSEDTRKTVRPAVAILLHELRKELDALLLRRLHHCLSENETGETDSRSENVIQLVIRILEQE